MKIWNVLTGETERVFTGHERGLACVAISTSGQILVSGSNDKTIRVWDASTGACLAILKGHTDLVRSLAIDDARGIIVSGGYDRTTRVWDWKSEAEIAKYKQHTSLVFHVELNASRIVRSVRRVLIAETRKSADVCLCVISEADQETPVLRSSQSFGK